MGTLYLVSTPIGNLEDITQRALRVLREARLVAAEDTRRTRQMLTHFDIHTPLTSYFEHNKISKLDVVLSALVEGDVAIVSDAGTPALSDPGYELVRAALKAGHAVTPIPGPSALLAALVASGLPTDSFVYVGFLPRSASERRQFLASLAAEPRTLVAYETPHRLLAALEDIEAALGDRSLAVGRELTKMHEEFFRGPASAAREHFSEGEVRGEITLVIAGAAAASPAATSEASWPEERVIQEMERLLAEGMKRRDAARQVAQASGWLARDIYQLTL